MSVKAYEQLLNSLATSDERIVVMTAENRAAIRTLPTHIGSRFIDVGICEQTLLGVAAGLAARGRRPIVHALAAFLTMRGFEFIRTDIGIGNLPVILVGGVPGLLSDGNGPTHQAIEDIALMRGIPGMAVVAPSDEGELLAAISAAVQYRGPCYVRYCDGPPTFEHSGDYQFGKGETLGDTDADIAILTYGFLVGEAVKAQALLARAGVNASVIDMRTIAPLDEPLVLHCANSTQLLVILEDHFQIGGLFSAIAEVLAIAHVRANLLPINLKGRWFKPGHLRLCCRVPGYLRSESQLRFCPTWSMNMENTLVETRVYPCIDQSNSIWDRANKVIPAGTQTLAKGPSQWVRGVAPKYLQRGCGSRVWDVDGNEYIDLTMAVGPVSLGYAYPAVDQAIRAQLSDGITFTLMHPLEVEVAELLSRIVPGAEMVRFSKTGCDVTSAAIRLARAFTGRPHVLCCGYHGWHDWYVSVTDRAHGVPPAVSQLTYTFEYNDLDSVVDAIDDSVAAIILEPTVFEAPKPGFLEGLRHICDEHGTVLIFDEMWTGFRLSLERRSV